MAIAVDSPSADTAEQLWFLDTLVTVHVPRASGADGISLLESVARAGDSPPLHVHRDEDEVFFVLEGVLRLHVDGEECTLQPGEAAIAPRGSAHTYRVESGRARWLVITAAAPFEQFVRALSRPAGRSTLPPASGAPDEAAVAALTATAAAHGIAFVGPPLA